MTVATPNTYLPGVTIRVTLGDLTHVTDGAVTAADTAVVSFSITDLAGTEIESGAGTAATDDWYLDFDTPTTPGQYKIIATALYNGTTTLIETIYFNVRPV